MSQTVVHDLEVVQIQEEDGDRTLIADGPAERSLQAVTKQGTIRQAVQRVVERQRPVLLLAISQRLFDLASIGDVGPDADRADDGIVVVAQRHEAHLEPVSVDLHRAYDLFAGQRALDGVEEGIDVSEDGVHRRADDELSRDAERFETPTLGHREHAIYVHGE